MSDVTLHLDPKALLDAGFVSLSDIKSLNEAGLYDLKNSGLRLCLPQIARLRSVSYQRLRNYHLCGGFRLDKDNKLSIYDAMRLDLSDITDLDNRTGDKKRKRTALKNLRTR